MYQQKARQDVGSSKSAENVNVNAQKAQSSSPRKAYNVGKEAMQAVKNTANKYAILGEQEEDVEVLSLSNQDKETVDKYVEAKSKPSDNVVGKWKQGMFSYFTKSWETKYGKEQNENKTLLNGTEVYADESELAKFMTANEVSGKGSDYFSKL